MLAVRLTRGVVMRPSRRFRVFVVSLALIGAVWLCLASSASPAEASGPAEAPAPSAPLALPALSAALGLQQELIAAPSPVQGEYLGYSVAMDGDTAIVGAPDFDGASSGAAYVFVRAAGVWSLQQRLSPSDGVLGDRFGSSVAIDGDTAVVGADTHDLGSGGKNSGAAYVFTRAGSSWTQEAELAPSDHSIGGDCFGWTVDIDGDTAVVGAVYRDAGSAIDAGAAYAFVRADGIWTQQYKFALADPGSPTTDEFGCAVAVEGDTAVIGCNYRAVAGRGHAGAAFVYVRSAGVWTLAQTLTASDGANSDVFGNALALDGDRLLIGAERHDTTRGMAGAGYLYTRTDGHWSQSAELKLALPQGGEQLGSSVALDGDTAVLGAPLSTANGVAFAGSAYVFHHSSRGWSECARLMGDALESMEESGQAVAVSGEVALVGSPYHTLDTTSDAGAVFSFVLEDPPITTVTVDPALNAAGWTLACPVTVTLSASAGATAIDHIEYRQYTAPDWIVYSDPFSISWPGLHSYECRSFSVSGMYEMPQTFTVGIGWPDKPPSTVATVYPAPNANGWNTGLVTVTLTPTAGSQAGIATTEYRLAGATTWQTYGPSPFTVSAKGIWVYEFRSADLAGLAEDTKTVEVRIGAKPKISSLSPLAGRRGSTLTIKGSGFGKTRGASYVLVGAKKVTRYLSWSASQVKVRVPSKAAFGAQAVKLVTQVGTSNARTFKVKR